MGTSMIAFGVGVLLAMPGRVDIDRTEFELLTDAQKIQLDGAFAALVSRDPVAALQSEDESGDGLSNANPWDDPFSDEFSPDPFFPSSRRSGAANIIAAEILFQTLRHYGVRHLLTKERGQYRFKILQSETGYFAHLTTLDVIFALREMSRFLVGYMCDEPTAENLYKLFVQIPRGRLGLRFMHDMAWALLGNSLPRDPNHMMALNSKWKILDDVARQTGSLHQDKQIISIMGGVRSVLNAVTSLKRLHCFVDVRHDPSYEYVKMKVVKDLLKLQREFDRRAAEDPTVVQPIVEKEQALKRTRAAELLASTGD